MPAGRPSGYVAKYHVPWVRSLARTGLTVKEIAEEIGVAKSTLCKWVAENQELSDALNEGRSYADSKVEESLYRLALGGIRTETRKTIVAADGDGQKPLRVEVVESESTPNATACIFWLKNRKPTVWRDQQNIDMRVTDNSRAEIEAFLNDGETEEIADEAEE